MIDEYPYVARASKSLASTLQFLIDKNKDSSKLFLILCGSSMSYMEDHVLAYGIVGGTPQIEDNMFRFWYRFVPENTSIISRGATDLAYKRIAPQLSFYMGGVFEEICKQYLWRLLIEDECAVNFSDIGRWWGANPKTKSQEEIDMIGTDKDTALFAECKWPSEKVDLGVLETLVERSTLFSFKKKHFYLFAKTGFTKGCIDKVVEMGNVTLVVYEDMLKV